MEEVKDATADLTLEEIGLRDKDNLELVHKDCQAYFFDSPRDAGLFMGETLNKALKRLGIDMDAAIRSALNPIFKRPSGPYASTVVDPGDDIELQMKFKGVRVERRVYDNPEDAVRSGLYVYYRNEIAYFISEPFVARTLRLKPISQGEKVVDLRRPFKSHWDRLVVFTNYRDSIIVSAGGAVV